MISMDQKLARIAAGLAISNLGHVPMNVSERSLLSNSDHWSVDEASETCNLAGHLMEDEDMEKIFCDEAYMWRASIKNKEFLAQQAACTPWVQKILEMDS